MLARHETLTDEEYALFQATMDDNDDIACPAMETLFINNKNKDFCRYAAELYRNIGNIQNHARALLNYGWMVDDNHGPNLDTPAFNIDWADRNLVAKRYYRRAANLGNPIAMYNLGLIYFGRGSYDKAAKCFQDAINKANCYDSMYKLGIMYLASNIQFSDKKTKFISNALVAKKYFKMAATLGSKISHLELIKIYLSYKYNKFWIKKHRRDNYLYIKAASIYKHLIELDEKSLNAHYRKSNKFYKNSPQFYVEVMRIFAELYCTSKSESLKADLVIKMEEIEHEFIFKYLPDLAYWMAYVKGSDPLQSVPAEIMLECLLKDNIMSAAKKDDHLRMLAAARRAQVKLEEIKREEEKQKVEQAQQSSSRINIAESSRKNTKFIWKTVTAKKPKNWPLTQTDVGNKPEKNSTQKLLDIRNGFADLAKNNNSFFGLLPPDILNMVANRKLANDFHNEIKYSKP